jgi:hypothetical protein
MTGYFNRIYDNVNIDTCSTYYKGLEICVINLFICGGKKTCTIPKIA